MSPLESVTDYFLGLEAGPECEQRSEPSNPGARRSWREQLAATALGGASTREPPLHAGPLPLYALEPLASY
jgi:hypothetical protein